MSEALHKPLTKTEIIIGNERAPTYNVGDPATHANTLSLTEARLRIVIFHAMKPESAAKILAHMNLPNMKPEAVTEIMTALKDMNREQHAAIIAAQQEAIEQARQAACEKNRPIQNNTLTLIGGLPLVLLSATTPDDTCVAPPPNAGTRSHGLAPGGR